MLEGYSDVKDISNALKKNELLKFLSGSELEELRIDDVSFFIEKVYDDIEDDDDLVEADKKYDKFKNLVSYKNSCISPVSVSPMYRNWTFFIWTFLLHMYIIILHLCMLYIDISIL